MAQTVTNAELAKRLDELTRALAQRANAEQPAWDGWRHDMELKMTEISGQVGRLSELVVTSMRRETRAETCPHQVEIARASNNHVRLGKLEETLQQVRIDLAKQSVLGGAAGGGVVTVIAGVFMAVGKALGWW